MAIRDDIVGILLAKDLLRLSISDENERFDIREYMRPAVFVPESKRLNVLAEGTSGAKPPSPWPSSSMNTAAASFGSGNH